MAKKKTDLIALLGTDTDLIALLGTDTDAAVAKKAGLTQQQVRQQRVGLGIPTYAQQNLARELAILYEHTHLLGTVGDSKLAAKLGVGVSMLRSVRVARGIPPCRKHGTGGSEAFRVARPLLGTMPDAEIARIVGRSRARVHQWRVTEGVPRYTSLHDHDPQLIASLGTDSDGRVARCHNVSRGLVQRMRSERGIAPYKPPREERSHCRRGHSYEEEGCYIDSKGVRRCKGCHSISVEKRRNRLLSKQRCTSCGKSRGDSKGVMCKRCRKRAQAANLRSRRKVRLERVEHGLCGDCGSERGDSGTTTRCRPCADNYNEKAMVRQKRRYWERKGVCGSMYV